MVKEDVPFNFGRRINPLDLDEIRKVVVIGTAVAERLFDKGVDPVGKDVRVKDVVMKVAGVFYDKGNRGQNSERVLMPLTTMQKIYGGGDSHQTTSGCARPRASMASSSRRRCSRCSSDGTTWRRKTTAASIPSTWPSPRSDVNGLFVGINVFIWFVGLGTLTAGIVGISNIMIITVKERTKEIGIRKALGATPFQIVSTLLLESTLVTGVAGYLGLVVGVGLLELVAFGLRSTGAKLPYFLNPSVDFQAAITAIFAARRRRHPRGAHARVARREDHAHRSDAGRLTAMFIDIEKWQEIFNTLRRHKLRTALTAFGVFWGIFMLTVLLGAGKGLENGVNEGFPRVTNTVFIWSQGPTQIPYQGMPIGRWISFKPDDVEAIAKNVASVGFIKGQNSVGIWGGSRAVHRAQIQERRLQRAGWFRRRRKHQRAAHHRRALHQRSWMSRNAARWRVIGQRVRDQLFAKDESPLGEDITVNGITFQVIGVFQSLQEGNQQQEEERIYLPNDTLRYAFNQIGSVGSFVVVPKPGIHASVAENDVKAYLAQDQQGEPRRPGRLRQLQPPGTSTTRCRACSPASSSSAGWSPSARSLRAPWAWATSC